MEQNPFPEIKLFRPIERVKQIGRFILDRFYSDAPAFAEKPESLEE